uniref:BTB domain-containing protein n=1 Tax=Kwoniella bestiolae CBS 10118 TaxID=1296100 RepID=A0A1B9GFW5_9TREE|nr:hypothetical protein I302_01463 [Kwoniella bestiolae CBS 10118]OCF29950.1 hypothetical protein I302_01463 [Kwoniella bestiolae CBS 10118]
MCDPPWAGYAVAEESGGRTQVNVMDPTAMSTKDFSSISDNFQEEFLLILLQGAKTANAVPNPIASYSRGHVMLDFRFQDSDLTIVTSDGVRFKVYRDVLDHTKSAFQDVLAVPQSIERSADIELLDTDIETSDTIKLFFTFLYSTEDIQAPTSEQFWEIIRLIRFCVKCDASDVLDYLRIYLYLWNSIEAIPFRDVILAGCYMDDLDLMVAAFANSNNIWGGGNVRMEITASLVAQAQLSHKSEGANI